MVLLQIGIVITVTRARGLVLAALMVKCKCCKSLLCLSSRYRNPICFNVATLAARWVGGSLGDRQTFYLILLEYHVAILQSNSEARGRIHHVFTEGKKK